MASAYDFVESRAAAESAPRPPGTVTNTGRFDTHFTLSAESAQVNPTDPPTDARSPLVVLIHGLGGSSVVWEPLELTLLGAGQPPLTVLKYDLAGRGFSPHSTQYLYNLAGKSSIISLSLSLSLSLCLSLACVVSSNCTVRMSC
jgi:pimeloyl-ACP methyl ester carboxylesterase